MRDTFETYGPAKSRRWRVVAANGKKLANGGQGYSRRIDLRSGAIRQAMCVLEHFGVILGPTGVREAEKAKRSR